MNFDDKEKKLLKITSYFLDKIKNKEANILEDTFLPRIERESDFIDGTLNILIKAQDILYFNVLERAKGELQSRVKETIENLKKIIQDIRLHEEKISAIKEGDFEYEKLGMKEGYTTKITSDSNLVLNPHKRFRYTKRDIAKIACYQLIELNKQRGLKNFKAKAIETLYFKFNINLNGDDLKISLIKISSPDESHILVLPKNIPNEKLIYPTFETTL